MSTAIEQSRDRASLALEALLGEESEVTFAVHGRSASGRTARVVEGVRKSLAALGRCREIDDPHEARLVLNVTTVEKPEPFRRQSRAVFVATVLEGPAVVDPLAGCYPYLIRTLSNVLLYTCAGEEGEIQLHFVTPERGHARLCGAGGDPEPLFAEVAKRLLPIASSHLVIENEFHRDLPEGLWSWDQHTRAFLDAGRRLDALRLLPAPFDLTKLLSEEDLRHLHRLYKMGGLSHGNMSERLDEERFWMSASGVDKSAMQEVGRDILLVKGFSPERMSMLLSVPPHVRPRRVSVDAIEHWMIYREHPGVGAILHVHAWLPGVDCTSVPYPCGTVELAHAVAELVRRQPDPDHCVIGLKNHGLTITGESLKEILDRVGDRLLRQIPME